MRHAHRASAHACAAQGAKNSPAPQDTQPLTELQNQPHELGAAGGRWGSFDKAAQPLTGLSQEGADAADGAHQQQQGGENVAPPLSPAAPSEVSMELTNDTLQGPGSFGMGAFGGREETDSFTFNAAFAAGGPGMPARDTTHNITNDIPGAPVQRPVLCARWVAPMPVAFRTHHTQPGHAVLCRVLVPQACPHSWRRTKSWSMRAWALRPPLRAAAPLLVQRSAATAAAAARRRSWAGPLTTTWVA
jgi:hypothetical protein